MCEQCFVQAENYFNRSELPVMKGFTFNSASLKFLRKVIFKILVVGGGNRREPGEVSNDHISDLESFRFANTTKFSTANFLTTKFPPPAKFFCFLCSVLFC